jgi:LuxR family maltose regulon positive regulatory protein
MSISDSGGIAVPGQRTSSPAAMPRTLRLGVPKAHAQMLLRRQLVDVLRRGARGPVTLVSAPAGYGKTALVESWASAITSSELVAWMTMHEDDESQTVFWASALGALRAAGLDVVDVPAPAATEGVDRTMLAGLARRVNAHPTPVVWVLDCGEFSLSPTLGDGLHRLVEACPERLRLVLLTRADPPLPLHRYRLAGTLAEIRAADLVFTASETSALLRRAGLDLAPLHAVTLRSRTGGWPAGLQFAALTLAGRVDVEEAIGEFRGDSGNVAAYLTREVYTKQPRRIQQFLLRTCLVDEVNPPLATALTGQDCETGVLQFVARGNAFMEPVPGRPGWYRYQPLFREFLRSQLTFEHPELKPVLHRAAAEQLAGDGLILPGLQHAVAAGDWTLATRVLVDGLWFGGLLVGGHRSLLRRLFAPMPADLPGAEAAVTRATLALVARDRVGCDAELDTARRHSREGPAAVRRPCDLAISILAAVSASLGDDPERGVDRVLAAELALKAVAPETRELHPDLLAVLTRSKATVLVDRGELGTALEALDEGLAAASAPHLGDVLEELHGMAALVHALHGDLRQAERIAGRLAPLGFEPAAGSARVPRTAVAALAWARLDEYDVREARSLLRCAEDGASSYDSKLVDGVLSLLQARLFVAEGRLELAHSALRAMPPDSGPGTTSSWLQRTRALTEARLLLAQRRPREAAEVARGVGGEEQLDRELVLRQALQAGGTRMHALTEPSARALEHVPLEVRVDAWLALAEQSFGEGDVVRSEACVERALRLAAPERLRRPFLEATPDVRALLGRRSLAGRARWLHPESPPHEDAAHTVGQGPDPRPPVNLEAARGEALVNPLTKKELEVLGHLAELLTTEEIAEAMYVSVNTVRSHVRNILRKLGVARRNEAVRRAWDLQLLPPPNVA